MIIMSKKTARYIIIAIVVSWLSVIGYTLDKGYISDAEYEKPICGTIVSMKAIDEVVGGKRKSTRLAVYGEVDFGMNHGSFIVKINPLEGYRGVGGKYCVPLKTIKKPEEHEVLEFLTFLGCALIAGLLIFGLGFCIIYTIDKAFSNE